MLDESACQIHMRQYRSRSCLKADLQKPMVAISLRHTLFCIPSFLGLQKQQDDCLKEGSKAWPWQLQVFNHNDATNLEAILRTSIAEGQPRTHRPWKKILVIVEGIYSMEGQMCNLAEIVEIKKRYKVSFGCIARSFGA